MKSLRQDLCSDQRDKQAREEGTACEIAQLGVMVTGGARELSLVAPYEETSKGQAQRDDHPDAQNFPGRCIRPFAQNQYNPDEREHQTDDDLDFTLRHTAPAADSSPPRSKAARIAEASFSDATTMPAGWPRRP
jgi:hypothetical protein